MRQQRRLLSTLRAHRIAKRYHVSQNHSIAVPRQPVPAVEVSEPQPSNQERQRQAELEQDLQMARDIQQGLLLAAVPDLRGWELTAVSNPARDLGGDLYDFVALPDGSHGIMIGDVSGKGLPAALRMAVARTLFRHHARLGNAPGSTLAEVNDGVCSDIPQGMVTMLYIVLDPQRGELRIANAGHTYPLLLNGSVAELELSGVPLGVLPDIDYEEMTIKIEPGDSVFLYTDGITEATDTNDVMFGSEYLQELLVANGHLKPRALMRLLLNELRTWTPENQQDDDITMVVFRRRYTCMRDELRSIFDDVLGAEQAAPFWEEQIEQRYHLPPTELSHDDWIDFVLPDLTKAARTTFNRGLARELGQQLRLVVDEYRSSTGDTGTGPR
jgi:sigma-B regulation protein RsbU (phosphoserine phosphatase)